MRAFFTKSSVLGTGIRTASIVEIGDLFCRFAPGWHDLELMAVADELKRFLSSMKKVVAQARRSQLEGETVPAAERRK